MLIYLRRRNKGAWHVKVERKARADRKAVILNLPLGGGVKLPYFYAQTRYG